MNDLVPSRMNKIKMFSIFAIVLLATLFLLSSSATFQYPAQE